MSDFAAISRRILKDDDYRSLSHQHREIWFVLLLSDIGGRTGIFKGGVQALAIESEYNVADIEDALREYEARGWIVADGEWRWIKNYIEIQGYHANWKVGSLQEAEKMIPKTPLAQKCLDYYQRCDLASVGVRSPRHAKTSHHITAQQSTSQQSTKPNAKSLANLLARLDPASRVAWDEYVQMAKRKNDNSDPTESWKIYTLERILSGTEGCPPEALRAGLLAAVAANHGQGSTAYGYVVQAAKGWHPAAPTAGVPEPELRVVRG